MLTTVPPLPAICYAGAERDDREEDMKFDGQLDLSGLKTALCIEECGGWHLYDPSTHLPPSDTIVAALHAEILASATPAAMPPDPRLLRLLVDAATALHGETTRALGWRMIGLSPNQGRRLLGAEQARVSWCIYHTALCLGLGYTRFEDRAAYYED